MYKEEFKEKHQYSKDSKCFVCKTPRLCVYLQKKGFNFDSYRPDKYNPKFLVWIFKNSDKLQQAVSEYYKRLEEIEK